VSTSKVVALGLGLLFLAPQIVLAQAFGEYGRTVGGVTQRQGSGGPKAPGGRAQTGKGKGVFQGVGDVGGRPVPSQLVVTSKEAALYPRQDDESEKLDRLAQGETLVPMVQSNGGNGWYMVKTQRGLVGWVKSADVREESGK
jgi:hypothetical protein